MRGLLAVVLLASHAMFVRSDELNAVDALPWTPPFRSSSAQEGSDLAVLLVITNDDPFGVASPDSQQVLMPANDANPAVNLWCVEEIRRAYRDLIHSRPDLQGQLSMQGLAAGLPQSLTGGENRNIPARAVLAFCDPQYRLLGIHVGIPQGNELISMVEDAEEVATIRQLRMGQSDEINLNEITAQRSRQRLDRMWVSVLDDVLRPNAEEVDDHPADSASPISRRQIVLIGETLEAAYLADVRRRFGLDDASDQTRLILLEQHLETRQPWCDALIAMLAGQDYSLIWRDVVELVWHYPPITRGSSNQELRDWVALHRRSDLVVLALEPPAHAERFPWPPIADVVTGRVQPWRKAHNRALDYPFRTVSAEQLARLSHELKLKPMDIQRPALARYVLLEPNRRTPIVIHETDSPARLVRRLSTSKSSLEKP